MKPSSFCTISTYKCINELYGLLISLSIYHKNETIYIVCDTNTKKEYDKMSIKPELKICWYIKLDKYSNLNRSQMEQMKIWSEFQMFKSIVLDIALENESDTLFLDSDVVVTSTLDDIDISKCLGVCPGFVNNDIAKKYGYFNGGMLWVKNKNIPEQWRT